MPSLHGLAPTAHLLRKPEGSSVAPSARHLTPRTHTQECDTLETMQKLAAVKSQYLWKTNPQSA